MSHHERQDAQEGQLARLRAGKQIPFAVRSSALSEDSALASFAGQFDSVLDVRSDDDIGAALRAVPGGKLFILQARPISTLNSYNPIAAEWNDTLKGSFLWSATNLMEAQPEVLTPWGSARRPLRPLRL